MRRTIRIAALAVAVCFPGAAFAQPISYGRVLALPAPPPTHRIAYGTDSLQFGNLRLPSGNAKHPLVIFIHGGCFRAQYSIDHVKALEQAIADSGYAVWSIDVLETVAAVGPARSMMLHTVWTTSVSSPQNSLSTPIA